MDTDNLFVVTISNHPVLGPLLIPYFAHRVSDKVIMTDENATVKSKQERAISKGERKIISLAQGYTERTLMKAFSKERTLADFFHKMSEKVLNENIRPYIEKRHQDIIALIRAEGIPLYMKDMGADLLYDHHLVSLATSNVEVSFACEATDHYFRYGLHCSLDGRTIQLQNERPLMVLAVEPALLLIGRELLVFDRIRAGRISPFLTKKYVEAPASETMRYLEKIVLPLMEQFPVEVSGFRLVEQYPAKRAHLGLFSNFAQTLRLELMFFYGKNSFSPYEKKKRTYPYLEKKAEEPTIFYFQRDKDWEQQCINFLIENGFRHESGNLFRNYQFESDFAYVDWISQHKETLETLFSFESVSDISYYIGPIEVRQEVTDTMDWFEVRIMVQIGEYSFPFIRFKKNILNGDRRYLLPDGKVALLPDEWFEKYNDLFVWGEAEDDKMIVKKIHAGMIDEKVFQHAIPFKKDYVEKENVLVPPKIKAVLRSYQQDGFSWLAHLTKNKLGGCLADDMGLGKTLQTITLLQYLYDPGPHEEKMDTFPIKIDQVGQLSLFGDEISLTDDGTDYLKPIEVQQASLIVMPTSLRPNWRREIRKFSTLCLYEYTAERRAKNISQVFNRYHCVLITYGILRRDIELLEKYPFKCVVLDESQYIKNPESQTYHSVMRLRSEHRFVLTGTPIENSLKDLWAQLNFINPGLLGSQSFFRNQFITPITKMGDTRMRDKLLRLISPFILRRTKQQVAPELPPLTEEIIFCEMGTDQKEVYQKEKNSLRSSLLDEWKRNKIVALNGILRLRQLANHPKLLYSDYDGSSGKMEQIIDTYETLLSEGHKVLIFSSFVTHLDLLGGEFKQRGWEYAMLTGGTSDREKEIARFSNDPAVSAFFISLKAGGVGLNLTEADYVFIIDPWWNPAAEMQAESRAHRIGQGKQVFVYRFISNDTIEEKIRALQERKCVLAETFISENDPLQSLTDQEWQDLLKE